MWALVRVYTLYKRAFPRRIGCEMQSKNKGND